jgi:hypothetical protein
MSEDETLRPCPLCERCAMCRGTRIVTCAICSPRHDVDCMACEICGLCGGTHLVTVAERERWIADLAPTTKRLPESSS